MEYDQKTFLGAADHLGHAEVSRPPPAAIHSPLRGMSKQSIGRSIIYAQSYQLSNLTFSCGKCYVTYHRARGGVDSIRRVMRRLAMPFRISVANEKKKLLPVTIRSFLMTLIAGRVRVEAARARLRFLMRLPDRRHTSVVIPPFAVQEASRRSRSHHLCTDSFQSPHSDFMTDVICVRGRANGGQ
ncbi:hypothetical protein EVAR_18372_1 [Eumeta japonica]|uniref:Uncharacterized protein n=1 Tax=Eumeta variegata TaxID=151549 RepID=A0A4C1UTS1_EUMVA|nr:hypothetical protein EVAR_18372_1 [Eumeta japonica]